MLVFLQESESDSAWMMSWPEAPMLPEASPLGGLACPLGPGTWESQTGRTAGSCKRFWIFMDLPKIWRYLKYGVKHRWNGKLWKTIKHVIYIYNIYSSFWDVFSDLLRCLAKLCCVNCVQVTDPHHTSVQWLQHFPQRLGRLCHGDGWMCHWRQCQALAIPRPSQRLPTSSEL